MKELSMGADFYAKAIIGVPLPDEDKLPRAKVTVRKKAFNHKYEDNGETEFHPKDGRKLWLDEKEEVEEDYPSIVFDTDDCANEDDLDEGQRLIKIPKGLECANGTDGDSTFLGAVLETGSSNGGDDVAFRTLDDIGMVKLKVKDVLEPLGLWDEKKFGLYAVLYCSY
jgi:hypothetical protein